jgi:hypothetical protein
VEQRAWLRLARSSRPVSCVDNTSESVPVTQHRCLDAVQMRARHRGRSLTTPPVRTNTRSRTAEAEISGEKGATKGAERLDDHGSFPPRRPLGEPVLGWTAQQDGRDIECAAALLSSTERSDHRAAMRGRIPVSPRHHARDRSGRGCGRSEELPLCRGI